MGLSTATHNRHKTGSQVILQLRKALKQSASWRGKSLLTLKDYSTHEIACLLNLSAALKKKKEKRIPGQFLAGKNIVLLFEKTSTRTRCAFEVAAMDEGANTTFLGAQDSQMGKKESIEDTAKVLGRFYDGIEFRGYAHETAEELAAYAGVPVWNGLTDTYHPTQVLADLMTINEKVRKPFQQISVAYVGDARNNMANSLMIGAAKMGMDFRAVAPPSLFPEEGLVEEMRKVAGETGGSIRLTENIQEGVLNADVIYTDVWVSMGEEDQFEERISLLKPYQVNEAMMAMTGNPETLFMHCLPAFHDNRTVVGREIESVYGLSEMEVTDQVFRSNHSVVFDQAENRMHTIKALLVATLGPEGPQW